MVFLFNWIIYFYVPCEFQGCIRSFGVVFLMSKMKLTILKFLSCIDPTPRRNKHSWLEVMTSTREPINTALDFFICQSHLKHVCSGQVLVNVYIYIYLYLFVYTY